jgi:TRAP-type mannitol/chloroaromatic compound transport system permease small subunit
VILVCFALLLLQALALLVKKGAALAGHLPLEATETGPRDPEAMRAGQPEGI